MMLPLSPSSITPRNVGGEGVGRSGVAEGVGTIAIGDVGRAVVATTPIDEESGHDIVRIGYVHFKVHYIFSTIHSNKKQTCNRNKQQYHTEYIIHGSVW